MRQDPVIVDLVGALCGRPHGHPAWSNSPRPGGQVKLVKVNVDIRAAVAAVRGAGDSDLLVLRGGQSARQTGAARWPAASLGRQGARPAAPEVRCPDVQSSPNG